MKYAINKIKIHVICCSADKPIILKKVDVSFADEIEMEFEMLIRILCNPGKVLLFD